MTISSNCGGTVLFFSQEELAAASLSPDSPSEEEILALIRQSAQPIPQNFEVKFFPSRQGILVFVLPRLPDLLARCHFSVTFS